MNPLLFILILGLIISACSKSGTKNNEESCDDMIKSFSTQVNPIIQTHCNQPSCHASGSVNGPGPITNYSQAYNARSVIREAVHSGYMPQNATLTVTERKNIICWIDQGAPNN